MTGVPPEKNGDMAWIQHMIKSMNNRGRMAVVLPSGVLFRKGVERQIRKSLIDQDLLETVINLGPNIFYGTPLAPSILILRRKKTKEKKHKIFLIDAIDQIKKDRAKNYLEKTHVKTIFERYTSYKQIKNISKIISTKELKENNYSFDITLYLKKSSQKNLPIYKDMKVKINDAWNNSLKTKKIFLNILKKNLQ